MEGIKQRRLSYTAKSKVHMVSALEALKKENPKDSKVELQKKLRGATGSKVQVQMVEKWGTATAARKRGRRVNEAFERAVLDQLIFTSLEIVNDVQHAVVVANVCYSHALILTAVDMVKKSDTFVNDEKVQALK
eukprot:CAMPEP_0183346326 /NCGR_PEP_ID=MMETSP0164_2-20130417/11483_1 /TAXON_ID=221442 /ORGANISM="Coccolithus pelagicus ssp braarudi, Strain PLY182g" /LENGTH=133 /DNA_ID=CAMNT_0025517585 /DNA_START=315 /DNA_END=713 /DNA_ORIENTATION=+